MSIVDVERLNRYMSGPEWNQDQKLAARDVLDGLESRLESSLQATTITPRSPRTELCGVGASGQVFTRQPVFEVLAIDGVTVQLSAAEDEEQGIEPVWSTDGWRLDEDERRLYRTGSLLELSTPFDLGVLHVRAEGQVTVTYRPGWGPVPALVLAILDKASAIMINKHDDTISVRGTDGQQAPPAPNEDWSADELAKLGRFRNLTAWR